MSANHQGQDLARYIRFSDGWGASGEGREERTENGERRRIDQRLIRFGFMSNKPVQANKWERHGRRHNRIVYLIQSTREGRCLVFSQFPTNTPYNNIQRIAIPWQAVPCISFLLVFWAPRLLMCRMRHPGNREATVCTGYLLWLYKIIAHKFIPNSQPIRFRPFSHIHHLTSAHVTIARNKKASGNTFRQWRTPLIHHHYHFCDRQQFIYLQWHLSPHQII